MITKSLKLSIIMTIYLILLWLSMNLMLNTLNIVDNKNENELKYRNLFKLILFKVPSLSGLFALQ